jgi:hypothetical protein
MDVIVSRVCTVTVTNNASSWNRDLTYKRGAAMGGEFKKKGVNMLLGPVVGPAGRVVTGGRNWEGISVDPYLSGALVYETVAGIQDSGVITSTKVRTYFFRNQKRKMKLLSRCSISLPTSKRRTETLAGMSRPSHPTLMIRQCTNYTSGELILLPVYF